MIIVIYNRCKNVDNFKYKFFVINFKKNRNLIVVLIHKHCYNIINNFCKRKIVNETNKICYINYYRIYNFFRSFYYRNNCCY